MLDHIDLLTHRLVRESLSEYRYLCPVCDNDTLTVKKYSSSTFTAGAYQCWAGCLCKEIREAMGVKSYDSNVTSLNKWRAAKPKPYPTIVPPQILRLINVEPKAPIFRWEGSKRVMRYNYSPTQYTERIEWMATTEDGEYQREKSFRQYSNGRLGKGDEPWDTYLWSKIPIGVGNLVVVPEGEKSVQAWWLNGIAATCPQGSCWTLSDLKRYAQSFKDKGLYPLLIPDVDLTGQRKRDKWLEACKEVGLWCGVLDLSTLLYWQEGWDSHELLALHPTYTLLTLMEFVDSLGERLKGLVVNVASC